MLKVIIATIVGIVVIGILFYFDRGSERKVSKVVWLPTVWLLILSSRPPSFWFGIDVEANMNVRYQEGSPFDAAIFGLLIVVGVVVLTGHYQSVVRVLRHNYSILLFYIYCAVSVSWSDDPLVSLKRWIKAIGDVVMILILVTDERPVKSIKKLLTRIAFILLPLSVLFDKYYPNLSRQYTVEGEPMISGVTDTKNELGCLCLILGLAALWITLDLWRNRKAPNRSRRLIAHSFVVVLAYLLCYQANSMTSFSCLLMACAVMVLAGLPIVRRRPGLIHSLVWGFIGLSLFATVIAPSGGLLKMLNRNPTLTGRTVVWNAVLSMHTNPLIGVGYEDFWMGSRLLHVDRLVGMKIQEAHNGYMEIYLNLGWIGLILMGVMIATGYWSIVAQYRRDPHLGAALVAFFTAVIIYNISEYGFRPPGLVWEMFILSIVLATEQFHQELRMRFARRRSKATFLLPERAASKAVRQF